MSPRTNKQASNQAQKVAVKERRPTRSGPPKAKADRSKLQLPAQPEVTKVEAKDSEMVNLIFQTEVRPKEPKKAPKPRAKSNVAAIREYVVVNPKASNAEIIEALKSAGREIGLSTVSTIRSDTLATMRALVDAGLLSE